MSQSKMIRCPQCGYEYNETEHPQCPLCLEKQKEPGILIRLARVLIGFPRNVKLGLMGMSLVNIYFTADFLWKSIFLNILCTLVYGLFIYSFYKLKDKLDLRLWISGMLFISYVTVIVLIITVLNL